MKDAPRIERFGPALPPSTFTGFDVAVLAVLAIALISYRTLKTRAATGQMVTHTLTIAAKLAEVLSTVKDAETGQRGFLLTGAESYFSPYTLAKKTLPEKLAELRGLIADSAVQLERLERLEGAVTEKLAELQETVDLQLRGEGRQAIAVVKEDRGMAAMRTIRATVEEMALEERSLLTSRYGEFQASANLSLAVTLSGSALLFALLGIAANTAAYGGAVFDRSLKGHIVFSDHSLATDSLFAEVQLLSCRNVLIYFNRGLRERALGLFEESLCHKGFLGLGARESPRFSSHEASFTPVVPEDRLYQKR
ncbi:CHASE3 domain-containing protein [Corallococcus sp. AB045]|uniref:CHASE3 domain-containing protein n=1 Tax=Corallococcus sp. AB045 TaxID=2316719 RepID=UPI001F16D6C6|nr:CHASE3 domain-containing protein [Corallococcus sp. AB045]